MTTVFRSAIEASSIPIRSPRPASAWRTTATFSARAGRDICSPDRSSVVVFTSSPVPGRRCAFARRSAASIACPRRLLQLLTPASMRAKPIAHAQARRAAVASARESGSLRALPPARSTASASIAVRGELDLSTAPTLERPLEEALGERRRLGADRPHRVRVHRLDRDRPDRPRLAAARRRRRRRARGRLVICSRNDQVRRVLEISGLGAVDPDPRHPRRGARGAARQAPTPPPELTTHRRRPASGSRS